MEPENKAKLPSPVDMLEEAIREWWRNIAKFIMVYVWSIRYALIPLALVLAAYAINFWLGGNNSLLRGLVVFIGSLIALYVLIRAQIASFLLIKGEYQAQERELFQASSPLFWPYLKVAILQVLAVLAWALLFLIPGTYFIGILFPRALEALLAFLILMPFLFIPSVVFAIYYSLATYVFLSEDKRGWAAISRSRQLIKGAWGVVAVRLLLLGIFLWAIMNLFSIPLIFWRANSLVWQAYNVFLLGLSMILGPISLIYCFRLYRELFRARPQA